MSFDKGPKPQALIPPTMPDGSQPKTERQTRLATGGTRSTFLGMLAQGGSLAAPKPTLTGLNGSG